MSDLDLRTAIQAQAKQLQTRAEWIQRMIERQLNQVENSQRSLDQFRADLNAVNVSIDALREEYRQLTKEG